MRGAGTIEAGSDPRGRHEAKGVDANYPRDVIKEAFAGGLVATGDVWIEMLDHRNLLSHTYDEASFKKAFELVKQVFHPAIDELVTRLRRET